MVGQACRMVVDYFQISHSIRPPDLGDERDLLVKPTVGLGAPGAGAGFSGVRHLCLVGEA